MLGKSESEEWRFEFRRKGVGKRRPRPIDELISEGSESSSTPDATATRLYEAFGQKRSLDRGNPDVLLSTRCTEEKPTALVQSVAAWDVTVSPRTPETFAMPKAELLAASTNASASERQAEPKDRSKSDRRCHKRPKYRRPARDRHVVMLEQGSAGMRDPCVTILNNGPTAESSLDQEARATAFATLAQGLPRRRRGKERRPSMWHEGSESRFFSAKMPQQIGFGGLPLAVAVATLERLRRHQSPRNRQKLQRRKEVRKARRALLLLAAKRAT